jgi:hypothetical protein
MRLSQDMKAPIAIVIYLDADCRIHAASYGQNKALCSMAGHILDRIAPTVETATESVMTQTEAFLRRIGK